MLGTGNQTTEQMSNEPHIALSDTVGMGSFSKQPTAVKMTGVSQKSGGAAIADSEEDYSDDNDHVSELPPASPKAAAAVAVQFSK